jgi:F0F1-type ATP synthase epsilon subunit
MKLNHHRRTTVEYIDMNTKNIVLVLAGVIVGVALSASVLVSHAEEEKNADMAVALQKLTEQNDKLLTNQEAMMKDLATIKSDITFIKARSGQ